MTAEIIAVMNENGTGCQVRKNSKESIHSGHFMVSDFEAEAEDEEGLEVPEQQGIEEVIEEIKNKGVRGVSHGGVITYAKSAGTSNRNDSATICIDGSLSKLFRTMSLAYRHHITSPKWNRFKGLKLRWKDKIRLNNFIWRCWHMQFILRSHSKVCQFSLDVDIHNKPEAVVLEGKYWKRRLRAVTAEYRKWRVYYKNRISGKEIPCDSSDVTFFDLEDADLGRDLGLSLGEDVPDFDLMEVLFSSSNSNLGNAFHFPNPREIARGTENSDLLQPGLIQLQPDLPDDLMDFHEMLVGRALPTVPEEEFYLDTETAGLPAPASSPSGSGAVVSSTTPAGGEEFCLTNINDVFSSANRSPYQQETTSPDGTGVSSPLQHYFIPAEQQHQQSTPFNNNSLHSPTEQPPPSTRSSSRFSSPTSTTPYVESSSCRREHQRIVGRSQSQQELISSNGSVFLQEGSTAAAAGGTFAVPKGYSRHRSHSGNVSFTNAPQQRVITAVSVPSLPTAVKNSLSNGLPPLAPAPPVHTSPPPHHGSGFLTITAASVHPPPVTTNHGLFNHIVTDSFVPPLVPQQTSVSPLDPTTLLNTRLKTTTLPLVFSRGYSESSASSSRSNSSSSLTSNSTTVSHSSGISNTPMIGSSPLLSNLKLNAVTPPSIKSTSPSQVALLFPPGMSLSTSANLKNSPSHFELSPPVSSVPSPPSKLFRPKNDIERVQYKEHRRVCHINAEQKRRCNIKSNFEMLHSLIPTVNQNPSGKVSKATMLHKGAEYIQQLKDERKSLAEQTEQLRAQIDKLSMEISTAQSLLPATGAPVSHTRHNKLRENFDSYVKDKSLNNWKFWIFSLVTDSLLESYNVNVSTASVDDLCRSSLAWLDQHCSLNVLRPVASNAMRKLSTSTSILTSPDKLPEDIYRIVVKQEYSSTRKNSSTSSFSPPPPHQSSNSYPR